MGDMTRAFLRAQRFLEETSEAEGTGGVLSLHRMMQGWRDSDTGITPVHNRFDGVVFWAVNAFWITILLSIVLFFWKFKGAERLRRWTRGSQGRSDRALAARLRRRREQREQSMEITAPERREMLKDAFRRMKVHMTVTPDDFVGDKDGGDFVKDGSKSKDDTLKDNASKASESKEDELKESDSKDGDVEEGLSEAESTGMLQLRIKPEPRTVPNCCAVCLGAYEVGDSVVWSSNPSCQHAFHEECVTDWLVKMQGDHPCPCCRQPFVENLERPKKEEPGRSMNFAAIRL